MRSGVGGVSAMWMDCRGGMCEADLRGYSRETSTAFHGKVGSSVRVWLGVWGMVLLYWVVGMRGGAVLDCPGAS